VAFLFNLGVGYGTRTELLDWMKANRVPATMFPMGWWAKDEPEALEKMHQLGFAIGSHGDQRNELTTLSDAGIGADIRAAADAIEAVTGEPPLPYFTPYAAATDARVNQAIANAGYLPVGWDVPADDWNFNVTADHVFGMVMPKIKDGSVVEFHLDAPASKESTVVAVPWIVERLRQQGYTIVPLADIMLPCPAGLPAIQASPASTPSR
jgi:peptidoglycan/xylan/chitin deacetylase (PgdA/CDA1 family)